MNGQFKAKDFDKEQLKKFAADLKTNGLSFTMIWKKRNKVVEESNTKTNLCSLEIEGKWFFRQIGNKGIVRLKYLDDKQKKILLNVLGKYKMYTEPKWELGLGLLILYFLLEYYVSTNSEVSWLMPVIMSCSFIVVLFLGIAYLRAEEKIDEKLYNISLIFGIPAYLFTAIGSLLALPLYTSILRYHLKFNILHDA